MTFTTPHALFVLTLSLTASAAPSDHLVLRDQTNSSGSDNISAKIWAPILGVVIVLFALLIWRCSGRGLFQGILSGLAGPEGFLPSSAQTRELTAEQLAGSINRNTTAGNNNINGGRSRRNRRPRRSPSQMSTASLPAYMKEPGEQELVIFRGPVDLQDVPQPVAMVMPSVDEDGEENAPREYSPVPDSPADLPFLQENDSDRQDAINGTSDASDLRGEVPSYDEAIRASVLQSPPLSEVSLNVSSASPPAPLEESLARRVSGFRTIINAVNRSRLSHASPANDLQLGHIRSNSDNSITSSIASAPRSRSRSNHRPTPSSNFFRTLSRQRSIRTINSNHLTSPSVVSIDSISAPLTHTVIRTEFTYPRAGPTVEQLRLISSPEAPARFGVPYGADAIAFAASTSQQALEPPPDFDAAPPSTNLVSRIETSASAAETGTRTPPPASLTLPENNLALNLTSEADTVVQQTEIEVVPRTPTEPRDDGPASSAGSTAQAEPVVPSPAIVDGNHLSTSSKGSSSHPPTEFGVRAQSRMSLYTIQSYATASESMSTQGKTQARGTMTSTRISPPSTPNLDSQRDLEPPTDNATTLDSNST
ncbi:hypothetical protein AX15_000268 [Amanita polypyramis BW_CC]|nr:hypothetical protein AX15_000268 [Amanita polypyramis BW_CC]